MARRKTGPPDPAPAHRLRTSHPQPQADLGRAIGFGLIMATSARGRSSPRTRTWPCRPSTFSAQRRFGEYRLLNSDLFKVPSELADFPQSITVVPQEVIGSRPTSRCATRCAMWRASASWPARAGGAQGDNLTLRGFPARNDIYLDGVRDFGRYYRDTFNLEAVEVLKGPSSMLFGRGSTGGVINQVSKTPKLTPFYEGSVHRRHRPHSPRASSTSTSPSAAIAALRLNLMGQDGDVAGRDERGDPALGRRAVVRLRPGHDTRVQFRATSTCARTTSPTTACLSSGTSPSAVDTEATSTASPTKTSRDHVHIGTAKVEHDFNDESSACATAPLRPDHGRAGSPKRVPSHLGAPATASATVIQVTRNRLAAGQQETMRRQPTSTSSSSVARGLQACSSWPASRAAGRPPTSMRCTRTGVPNTSL